MSFRARAARTRTTAPRVWGAGTGGVKVLTAVRLCCSSTRCIVHTRSESKRAYQPAHARSDRGAVRARCCREASLNRARYLAPCGKSYGAGGRKSETVRICTLAAQGFALQAGISKFQRGLGWTRDGIALQRGNHVPDRLSSRPGQRVRQYASVKPIAMDSCGHPWDQPKPAAASAPASAPVRSPACSIASSAATRAPSRSTSTSETFDSIKTHTHGAWSGHGFGKAPC